MPDATEDFWPDEIPDATDPEAVALLKEQAERLGEKTNHAVEGVVKTSTEGGAVYYTLYLKADALGDYLYQLLYITYPAIGLAGQDDVVTVQSSAGGPQVKLRPDEFPQWLRTQLRSDFVSKAIGNLRRYVREARQPSGARP